MSFKKKFKELFTLLFGFAIYVLFLNLSGIHCPIKFITGISCPGCGMTRAVISAVKLDFKSAFYYNPMWCVTLPAIAVMAFAHIKNKQKLMKITALLFAALLIVTYVIRIIVGDSTVITVNPKESIFYKIFLKIKN